MKNYIRYILISVLSVTCSCKKYLDIVPDNVATLDNAFTLRSSAEKFLFTCYSYLPPVAPQLNSFGNSILTFGNPAWLGGDEIWVYSGVTNPTKDIARGLQNVANPLANYWDGAQQGAPLYEGIRKCNILIESIAKVPDMEEYEKKRWAAEATFLKAYYHFYLLRMYGPIVIMDKNLPITASEEEVKLSRTPVDSCFNYVAGLLDQVIQEDGLPDRIDNEVSELGRITKPIAMAVKARVLVTAASPLFNGNPDYVNFKDKSGKQLFNPVMDPLKWEKAAKACKEAIDFCHEMGYKLYYFPESPSPSLSSTTITKMNIRGSVTDQWNDELIWGNTIDKAVRIQSLSQAFLLNTDVLGSGIHSMFAPTIKMAELFYSENGVPIDEDKYFNYSGRRDLRKVVNSEKYNLAPGVQTAVLNFDREPRFYASLGFDGGAWYGQGRFDDRDPYYVEAKIGEAAGRKQVFGYSVTGYWPKKLVNYKNIVDSKTAYAIEPYPWPEFRLSDLYLLYAEALNESNPDHPDILTYLNLIRARAGLNTVQQSWQNFSKVPDKYMSQSGMRSIIRQERGIELAFEGSRFWDLRRWKLAEVEQNKPVRGWDIEQETAAAYYQEKVLFNQTFQKREYLWPLKESTLIQNNKLVQNPGW